MQTSVAVADHRDRVPAVPFGDLLGSSDQIRHHVSIERAVHAITGAFPSKGEGASEAPRAVVPHVSVLHGGLTDAQERLDYLASHLESLASDGRSGNGAQVVKGYA